MLSRGCLAVLLQPMVVPVVGTVPFMVFGADVTHPTSFHPDDPSIAAVCATYDRSLGRYMSRVLRQVRLGWARLVLLCAWPVESDVALWTMQR